MPRVAPIGENLIGKVCICSLGRVGIVAMRSTVTFQNGDVAECWTGMGFDGNGLWATSANSDVVVLDETLSAYMERVKNRPSNVLYGKIAVPPPPK